MKLPSFQFYPGDWMKDTGLRSVSFVAKGLWIEMLCLMFESEKRGYLQVNGNPPTKEQLARMTNSSLAEVTRGLDELKAAGVFSQTGTGIIFSRRMLRDNEIRNKRARAGKMGGNPVFKKGQPNPYYRVKNDGEMNGVISKSCNKVVTESENAYLLNSDELSIPLRRKDKQTDNLTDKQADKQKITFIF